MGMLDWMKGGKQEPVKLKVSDFNNTVESEDVVVIEEDTANNETHAVAEQYHELATNKMEYANGSNNTQSTDNNDLINWTQEIDYPEYPSEQIIDLLATEIFEDKNVYNVLAEKVAQKLTANILKHKHEVTAISINNYQSRTDKIKVALYPILETEIKIFVNEKIGGKL